MERLTAVLVVSALLQTSWAQTGTDSTASGQTGGTGTGAGLSPADMDLLNIFNTGTGDSLLNSVLTGGPPSVPSLTNQPASATGGAGAGVSDPLLDNMLTGLTGGGGGVSGGAPGGANDLGFLSGLAGGAPMDASGLTGGLTGAGAGALDAGLMQLLGQQAGGAATGPGSFLPTNLPGAGAPAGGNVVQPQLPTNTRSLTNSLGMVFPAIALSTGMDGPWRQMAMMQAARGLLGGGLGGLGGGQGRGQGGLGGILSSLLSNPVLMLGVGSMFMGGGEIFGF